MAMCQLQNCQKRQKTGLSDTMRGNYYFLLRSLSLRDRFAPVIDLWVLCLTYSLFFLCVLGYFWFSDVFSVKSGPL